MKFKMQKNKVQYIKTKLGFGIDQQDEYGDDDEYEDGDETNMYIPIPLSIPNLTNQVLSILILVTS